MRVLGSECEGAAPLPPLPLRSTTCKPTTTTPTSSPLHPHHPTPHLADVVAPQVYEHHMLRALLAIGQQLRLQGSVRLGRRAAPPRSRQRPVSRGAEGRSRAGSVRKRGDKEGEARDCADRYVLCARAPQQARVQCQLSARVMHPRPLHPLHLSHPLTHLLVTVPSSPTRHRISGEEATRMQPRACR